jgi:uncharacterized membrane protein YgaE (UPF0421/DUF939 family)
VSIVSSLASLRTASRGPLLQVAKTSIAAAIAWIACDLIFGEPPIFAAIAALLVVQPSVNQSLSKGVERSVGVILGVVVALGVGYLFGTASWVVLSTIVIALLVAWALRLGPGSANQIPISAMLVLSIGALTPSYAFERIVETIIGAVVGLAVNIALVPPVLLRPAHLAVARLLRDVSATLDSLAEVLRTPADRARVRAVLEQARALRATQSAALSALTSGRESLTLNPRGGRLRRVLDRDDELYARLGALVTRVIGMARSVRDHYDPGLVEDPLVREIVVELERAAHDLRLLGRDPEGTGPETTTELPALTAPIAATHPSAEHWVVIGSLLEDLRRVREEITGSSDF